MSRQRHVIGALRARLGGVCLALAAIVTGGQAMAVAPIEIKAASLLEGYWAAAAQDINTKLAKATRDLAANPESSGARYRAQRQATLAGELSAIIERANSRSSEAVTRGLLEARRSGIEQAGDAARRIGTRQIERRLRLPEGTIKVAGPRLEDVRAVALDTATRLANAGAAHAERAEGLFRSFSAGPLAGVAREQAVNDALVRGLISGDPRQAERLIRAQVAGISEEQAADLATYRAAGKQIIEVGGWSGSVASYAQLVSVTRLREATEAGHRKQLMDWGLGLVVITGSNSRTFCTRFLGLVCALTPEASQGGRYPLLTSLPGGKGPPFHPRCSKSTAAWVEGLMPDRLETQAARSQTNYERDAAAGRLTDDIGVRERR